MLTGSRPLFVELLLFLIIVLMASSKPQLASPYNAPGSSDYTMIKVGIATYVGAGQEMISDIPQIKTNYSRFSF